MWVGKSLLRRLAGALRAVGELLKDRWNPDHRHDSWQAKWSQNDYHPKWADRGVAPEIVDAVEQGWLPSEGTVLDIGCGLGEIAGWFAERGYSAVGVDIAEAAVERASQMFQQLPQPPQFYAVDVSRNPPPDRCYDILIDRGCFHQIPHRQRSNFARHLVAVAAPAARMMLFSRAFRKGGSMGDPQEQQRVETEVRRAFGENFTIERVAVTYLDRHQGQEADQALPGLVFWMSRK